MSAPIWYDNSETGAPVLNNAAGSLIALLRAVLINGFNVKAITSIAVAGGVATVTCPSHGYSSSYGKWIKITGANAPALDGVKQQTIVDADTFTYPAVGVADGSYTATDARRAPLGWTEPYAGTNKGIFARSAIEAGTQLLRVLDTAVAPALVSDARVLMLESATDVDSYVNPSPTSSQVTDAAGGYIHKGANSVAAKPWALIGTDRGFYFIGPNSASTPGETDRLGYWFGDGVRFFPGDAHFCLLSVNTASGGASATSRVGSAQSPGSNWSSVAPQASVVARSRGGAVVSEIFDSQGPMSGRFGAITPMASGVMPEILYLMQGVHIVSDASSKEVRGLLPGLAAPIANLPFAGLGAVSVLGPVGGDGRSYLAINARAGGSLAGNYVIDLSGPWYE